MDLHTDSIGALLDDHLSLIFGLLDLVDRCRFSQVSVRCTQLKSQVNKRVLSFSAHPMLWRNVSVTPYLQAPFFSQFNINIGGAPPTKATPQTNSINPIKFLKFLAKQHGKDVEMLDFSGVVTDVRFCR